MLYINNGKHLTAQFCAGAAPSAISMRRLSPATFLKLSTATCAVLADIWRPTLFTRLGQTAGVRCSTFASHGSR